jgi:hypothetical protein
LSDRPLDVLAFACACGAAVCIAASSWRAVFLALPALLIVGRD